MKAKITISSIFIIQIMLQQELRRSPWSSWSFQRNMAVHFEFADRRKLRHLMHPREYVLKEQSVTHPKHLHTCSFSLKVEERDIG